MKYHGIDPQTGQITDQAEVQTVISEQAHKVLRNTYALLALTMIPTVFGAFLGVQLVASALQSPAFLTFAENSPILTTLLMIGVFFLVPYALLFVIQKTANSALGVLFLLALTFFLGICLGPLLSVALSLSNGVQLIGYATGTTALIFFGLASYVTVTGKDFSGIGKFLFIGLIVAIVAMIANLFFQMPAFSLAISSVVVLLMSGYILYDVSRVIHGGETNYILAATSLYLSIYNLFIHLLRILIILFGNRN